jgi:succinyl-CoA synthetase beta subunit
VNLYEYQARAILSEAGLPVPRGLVARTPDEAHAAAREIAAPVVVKAQVHAGGRGKAGGVKLASTPDEAADAARAILGLTIKGLTVRQVLVAEAAEIDKEYYLGIVIDRAARAPLLMASAEGGVDIEEVAARSPEKILRRALRPDRRMTFEEADDVAADMGLAEHPRELAVDVIRKLEDVLWNTDASLVEINPLATTRPGGLWALDAKMSLDDNALFRHPELGELRDVEAEDPREVAAREAGLAFVALSGEIGCCVNGAGLAMATMDLVHHYGGEPANFLDIGGSSSPDKMVAAMRILTRDPAVRVVLINIFGGITRCDDVARGILQALDTFEVKVPIVIRLTGTNETEARELLEREGRGRLTWASTMDDAVREAIARARGGSAESGE